MSQNPITWDPSPVRALKRWMQRHLSATTLLREDLNIIFTRLAEQESLLTTYQERYGTLSARVAELADAPDLGSGDESREGSTPSPRTNFYVSSSDALRKLLATKPTSVEEARDLLDKFLQAYPEMLRWHQALTAGLDPASQRGAPMTRDELLVHIDTEVKKVLPENEDLDGEALESVIDTVNEVVNNACEAIDEAQNEEDDDETGSEQTQD